MDRSPSGTVDFSSLVGVQIQMPDTPDVQTVSRDFCKPSVEAEFAHTTDELSDMDFVLTGQQESASGPGDRTGTIHGGFPGRELRAFCP